MANSNANTTSVAFSGTATTTTPKALNSTSRFVSDAITISADAMRATVRCNFDNQGTPASGDYADIWVARSVDGTNYETDEHALYLDRANTYGTDDPGEDPAERSPGWDCQGYQKCKYVFKANQGGTRTLNLVAVHNEFRSA